VFDPPGFGEDLGELALRHRDDRTGVIEEDGARAGCALIERKYTRH
jgi:hypothetical protein